MGLRGPKWATQPHESMYTIVTALYAFLNTHEKEPAWLPDRIHRHSRPAAARPAWRGPVRPVGCARNAHYPGWGHRFDAGQTHHPDCHLTRSAGGDAGGGERLRRLGHVQSGW